MNLGEYRKKAQDLSQPENFKQALKENWGVPAVGLLFALSLWIRYIPEKGMEHLQALDPYMIYRMSQHLALSGGLPALDFTRYFPYATPIYTMNLGDIAVPAYLYRYFGFSAIFPNYMEFAQFYPAFMGAVGVVAMYFLGKELFDRFTGVSAAFFLATLSGVMHRTSAGFFEKEPTGTAFMVLSLLFFTRAWKNQDWKSGLISGLTLGIFTTSWGGSKMMWLLYPMIVGAVLFINEDIKSLIAAYTPTVLLGGFLAASFNSARFWITGKFFLANLGLLALLWSRYAIEEYELLEEHQLKYYVPSMSIFGGLMLALSPLYSNQLGNMVFGLLRQATQSGSGVIGGTVAENQAAQLGSLISSLSVNPAGLQILPLGPLNNLLAFITSFVNPWVFMILGIPVLGTYLLILLGKKYDVVDEVSGKTYYSYLQTVTISWLITATMFLASTEFAASIAAEAGRQAQNQLASDIRFYSLIAGFLSLGSLTTLVYYLKDEAYNIVTVVFGFLTVSQFLGALNVAGAGGIVYAFLQSPYARALLFPTIAAFTAFVAIYYMNDYRRPELENNWYYVIPFFWVMTNLLAASSRSRLVFLSGFSVTLIAGYGFAKAVRKARTLDLSNIELGTQEYVEDTRLALVILLSGIMVLASTLSGVAAAQQIGGSPSQAWEPALDYMENETPEGSVVLSWWDYGYWFESIGRRGSVADGGNFGYYTSEEKVNYPLAEFLTSSNPENHTDFIKKHSADYIALDRTMIGKYSAVSQIARRSNENFSTMQTLRTPQSMNTYLNRPEDERVARFSGRGLNAFAPVSIGGQQQNGTIQDLSVEIDEPITLRSGGQTLKINCMLTDEGRVNLGNTSDRRTIPYCAAERPAPTFEQAAQSGSQAGLVLVPEQITDSTLVRLYLMDGYGIDFVEKVDLNRFEYVKMWEIQDDLE